MKLRANFERVRTLIEDTVLLLCKNGIEYDSEFSVEALVVINVDNHTTFHASVKEKIYKQTLPSSSDSPQQKTTEPVRRPVSSVSPIRSVAKEKASGSEQKEIGRVRSVGIKRKISPVRNEEYPPKVVVKEEPKEKSGQAIKRQSRNTTPIVIIPRITLTPSTTKKQDSKEREEPPTKITKKQESKDNDGASVNTTKKQETKEKDDKEELTPRRLTRSSTPVVVAPEDTSSPSVTTRRANRLAAEQAKIQTRFSSRKSLTSTERERQRTASASPALQKSAPKKPESPKRESQKENGKTAEKVETKTNAIKREKTSDAKTVKDASSSSLIKDPPSKNVCESVSIDTRGVQEVSRKTSTSRDKGDATPAQAASSDKKQTFTQLKSSTEPILVSSKDFMKLSFQSANLENQVKQNGHDPSPKSPTASSPTKRSQSVEVNTGERQTNSTGGQNHMASSNVNDVTFSGSPTLSQNQINEVVQKVINMNPKVMKVKVTNASAGTIKVNVGLHGASKTINRPKTCPSCKLVMNSPDELITHECATGDQSNDNRVGNVFRCHTCQMMFMREENFHKHVATHAF